MWNKRLRIAVLFLKMWNISLRIQAKFPNINPEFLCSTIISFLCISFLTDLRSFNTDNESVCSW